VSVSTDENHRLTDPRESNDAVCFPASSYKGDFSVIPSIGSLMEKIGDMVPGDEPINYVSLRDEGKLGMSEVEWLLRSVRCHVRSQSDILSRCLLRLHPKVTIVGQSRIEQLIEGGDPFYLLPCSRVLLFIGSDG
jgi:hypothetical protein